MAIAVENWVEVGVDLRSLVEEVFVVASGEEDDLDDAGTEDGGLHQMGDTIQHDDLRLAWVDAAALHYWIHNDEEEKVSAVHAGWKEDVIPHLIVVVSHRGAEIWPSSDFPPIRDVALELEF
jgi:hypothetical protein